ncbi:MAG: spermidine synthase [Acidobacteriia bacterium]|nr:spermidine synthase [Terriglobia bacterium]
MFNWLYLLFFLSGFPALIYQIVWQRTLFTIYGVNVESVTIVVSAFMLGLGIGSLAGGRISKSPSVSRLLLFGAIELGIAAYGVGALPLFQAVARFSAGAPLLETGLLSFALVLVPTVLMGATLPLLVAELVRLSRHVGRSVGILYFVNTLGSAVACFVAAKVTMPVLGMSRSVAVAAALNVLVGSSVLILHFRWRGSLAAEEPRPASSSNLAAMFPFPIALTLVGLAGFISLGYEIVWYRIYSFASGGPAQCFAYVLGAFLAGVAFGSLLSRTLCSRASSSATRLQCSISLLVLLASLLGFVVVPLTALAVRHISFLWTLPMVAVTASMLGATFPLMCHISVRPNSDAGAGLSYLYLSNIIGSAAGAWVVGFVLLDLWSIRWISVFLALAGVLLALLTVAASSLPAMRKGVAAASAAVVIAAVVISSGPLFATVYGQMQYQAEWGQPGTQLTDIIETRGGVVTVDEDAAIFGGGVFDGWVSTDIHETDTVIKPLSLSLFHPKPEEVLIIGMSGGAWSEIIANHPQVKKEVIIEINPGYVQVVQRYPAVSPLLRNPKVELVIDDGRRWMRRNRQRKFDMIIMDTTYYWRAHATNLLSVEFLDLVRTMLKPGGILYYNTTFSATAQRTGAARFPYALRFGGLLAVSDSPIRIDKERWRNILLNYRLEGKPIFDPAVAEDRDILAGILQIADTLPGNSYRSEGMETRENILRRTQGKIIITDDNMGTEWGEYNWR